MTVIQNVLAWMETHIGDAYSKTYRWKERTHDCSSFVYKAFEQAGVKLVHKSTGKAVSTSMYEVYAEGFELIYPKSYSDIGKKLPTSRNLIKTLNVQPGDLVFYNMKETDRFNKITHISAVRSKDLGIIHALNPEEGVTTDTLTWGGCDICAIIRYIPTEPVTALTRELKKTTPIMQGRDVKAVQQVLIDEGISVGKCGADSKFGKDTKKGVMEFQKLKGLPVTGIVDMETTLELGFTWERPEVISRLLKLKKPVMTGDDVILVQGKLEKHGFSVGESGIDGKLGKDTDKAVRAFQKARGLKDDGIVGVLTATALGLTWAG